MFCLCVCISVLHIGDGVFLKIKQSKTKQQKASYQKGTEISSEIDWCKLRIRNCILQILEPSASSKWPSTGWFKKKENIWPNPLTFKHILSLILSPFNIALYIRKSLCQAELIFSIVSFEIIVNLSVVMFQMQIFINSFISSVLVNLEEPLHLVLIFEACLHLINIWFRVTISQRKVFLSSSQSSSVQSLSSAQLFVTPWAAARQASLSNANSQNLPKFMFIESVMPSNHLIIRHPLLLPPSVFPSIRVFSNESALHNRWLKYWSFSFNIRPSNEHPGLISFRMD